MGGWGGGDESSVTTRNGTRKMTDESAEDVYHSLGNAAFLFKTMRVSSFIQALGWPPKWQRKTLLVTFRSEALTETSGLVFALLLLFYCRWRERKRRCCKARLFLLENVHSAECGPQKKISTSCVRLISY